MATSLVYGNLTEIANNSTLSFSAAGETKNITAKYTDADGNVHSPYSISVSYADDTRPLWLIISKSANQFSVIVDENSSASGTRTKVVYFSITPTSGATPEFYTVTISQESEYNSSSATTFFKINSSQIADNQIIDFNCDGETKSIIATYSNSNATNAVPYATWFEYEDGESVQWLTVEMNANTFAITVTGNPLGNSTRTKNIVFYMIPQYGNAPVSVKIVVSQVSDTFNPIFSPASISIFGGNQFPYYGANLVKTVTATGFDADKKIVFETPDWITASYTQSTVNAVTTTTFTFTADMNPIAYTRSGNILIDFYGKTSTYLVEQNANTLSVTQDIRNLDFDYTVNSAAGAKTATFTGIPADASVELDLPSWITASFNSATGVLTVYPNSQNTDAVSRSYDIGVNVTGSTFKVNVEQSKNIYYYGHLKIENNDSTYIEKTVPKEGGTVTISATEIPTNATTMTYDSALDENYCIACGISKTFFSISRISNTSFELVFNPQEFKSDTREALIPFYSGNCCVFVHFTQEAYSGYITFRGFGDRYLKHFVSDSRPTFIMESTAKYTLSKLQSASWEEQSSVIYPLIVSANRDNVVTLSNSNTTTYKNYEAYKESVTSVTVNGVYYNKVTMGCVAYKFKFNSTVGSTGYCVGELMKGIRFSVRSDGWCVNGLRVAIQVIEKSGADEPAPSNVWNEIRGESDTNGFRTDLTYKGICVRKLNTTDDLYYGTTKTLTLDNIGGTTASPSTLTITANTRIFVYLTMENYTSVPNNYAYGSGVVIPTSFTFYALTADNTGINTSLLDGDWITYLDSETNGIGSDPYEPDSDGGSSATTTTYGVAADDIYLASDGPLNTYYDVPVSSMSDISVSTINQLFSDIQTNGMHCDDEVQLNDGIVAAIIRENTKLGLRLSPLYLTGQIPEKSTTLKCEITTGWNIVKQTTSQGTITEKLNLPSGCNLVLSLWACNSEFHPSKASELYANSSFWKGNVVFATMEDENGTSGNQTLACVGNYVFQGTGNAETAPAVITFSLNNSADGKTSPSTGVVLGENVYMFLTAYIQFNNISNMDLFTDMNCIGTYEELDNNGTKTRFGLKWTPEICIKATK